jgi:hypothetical protein
MVGAVPGLGSLLQVTEADAPEVEGAATDAELAGSNSAPLVAHIKDLRSGEISLYQGETHTIYKDPALAARLFRAAR